MITKHYQKVYVCGFIKNNEGKLLLVKRSKNDSFLPDVWELPGGGMEYEEDIENAVKREIKEECGLVVAVRFPLAINSYYLKEIQIVEILFLCTYNTNNQTIALSEEHSEYKWISSSELNTINVSSYAMRLIKYAFKNPVSKLENE